MKRKSLLNFLSKTGYKRNSPHVRRPMNLIPSGKITMKGVDFPVKGIDNLGNEQMMYPGLDYNFPGDYVLELPMMQPGGSTSNIKRVGKRKDEKNYIDSVLNANKNLDWVQRLYEKNPQSIQIPGVRRRATHYMESADNRVYPTVVRLPNSNLEYLGNDAYNYADSTKSFIQFPSDEEAQWFAKNYKKGTAVLPKKQKAGEWMGNKLDKQGLITYETKGGNYIAGLGNSIDGDQYINRMIDSGKFGYNPNNGALVRLGKPSSGMSKESAFYASPIYKELTSPVGKRKGEEGFLNRNQEQLFDSLPKWQQDIVEEHNAPLRNAWVKKSNKEMYESPLTYVPGMIGFSMLPLGFSSAYGLASSLSSAAQGNYKTAALEAGLSALPFASRAYRLNPNALKQPNLILTRTQKPGQTADLARLDELLQKQKLTKAEEIELVKLSQPGYGRGFDSNPNSINYYANPNIQQKRGYSGMPEIRVTSLPAEEAAKFNVGKNPVKDYISFKKDKEFLLPRNYVEASKSFMPKTYEELDQLRRAIDAEQTALSTPHWWRGYPSTPKQLPGSGNVNQPVGNIFSKFFKKEIPDWAIKEMRFSSLPELNNKQATEVLENFRARIKTTEGQKRLKELGITDTGILNDLKILADDETLGHYWFQKIGLNPNLPEMKRVTRHEIEHAVQEARNISLMNKYNQDAGNLKYLFRPKKGRLALEEAVRNTTDIDELLKGLELRKTPEKVDWNAIKSSDKKDPAQLFEYMSNKQRATNYFDSGSGGKEKSAFLGEVQQYMMDNNIIPKTSYVEVTPEMVKNTFVDAMFDETGGGKYLRLFNIMKPTEANYKLISEGLNKMLGLVPPAAIIGAGAMQEQKYGGALPKAQLGKYIPSWLNPYNWGVEDYSEYKTRGQAFNAARNAGEEEFMYKGKRYNTRKDTDDLNITMPDKNLNPGWTGKKYNDWLKTNYPEFFKVINRGKGVNEIEFGYDWRNTGSPTRASYSDWLNKIYVGSKEINLDNRTPVDEFIGRDEVLGSIIAEMAHAKDSKISNNPFKSYAWKPGIDNFRYGKNTYNVPGTVEYNTHRLYEPGLAMIAYGDLSPNDIKRIQKYLGVKEDGYLGEKTYKAIQDKYNNSPYIKNALEYHQIYTRDADKNAISMGDYARLAKAYLHQINQDVPLRDSTRFFDVDYNSDYTDDALLNIKSGSGNYDVKELQRALHKRGYKLPNSINEHDNFDGIYGDETKTALLDYQSKLPKKQLAGENYIPASESTGVNTYIRRYDLPVITKEMQDERELARRKQAIQASQKAGSKPFFSRERWTPENFALETGATGDKLRFFPDDPDSFIDEYLNPLKMIGDMASGLGRMPLNISQGNYGQAAMSVATPLVAGVTAGLGAKSAGQFVNNLANPLVGAGEFLTTQTPLKNAHMINPWAFKPKPNMYYRQVGEPGYLNAIQENRVLAKGQKEFLEQNPGFNYWDDYDKLTGYKNKTGFFSLEKPKVAPFFQKGELFFPISTRTGFGSAVKAAASDVKYLFEGNLPDEAILPRYRDSYLTREQFLGDYTGGTGVLDPKYSDLSNFKIYKKDWLRGYKPVNTPVNTPKQLPGFRSEIDWGKWNPDTPKYPELINEYNAIEESTKKAGTWMKNADGSPFKGTAEQFIQQQSSYFKKAFPNPVRERRPDFFSDEVLGGQDPKKYFDENMPIQYNYHSSPNEFDFFDENLFSTGGFGKGIYTTRLPQNMYGKNQYQLYLNANNPQPYSYTRFVTKNGSEVAERVNAPKLVHEKTFYQQLEPGRDYFNPAEESSQSVVPFSNYPKSAKGNVGFYDMANPNIYKKYGGLSKAQLAGQTPSTYYGGTLPEVFVSSDQVPYPYYNQLTPEEKRFFNDEGSIGRGVRSIAKTGKRGQTYNDLSRVAKDAEIFAAEMTGIPGSIRFAQDPVKKLKGAGRTLEATILGSSPFITSPYNEEDVADFFDTMDAFGFATLAFAPLKTPLQQGIKSSAKYLTQGPLRNAWKLNPKAYQYNLPENTMWRGLGKEGMEDAISSRLFRAKQDVIPVYHGATKLRLNKSFGTNPYFTPKFKTAATYGADYLAEVPRGAANWRQRYIRSDWSQVADRPIPINEGRILKKDWWMGYKPVEVPKQLGGMTTLPKAHPLYLSGLSDVSHSKNGGELFNGYKRYIMGDYKPEEEKDLKNTYDKLNRNYYKKAKESGMTAPNYIMSML